MKILSWIFWGARKESLLTLYRTLMRSILDYGILANFLQQNAAWINCRRIQNRALRICCGGMPISPILTLQASCNEMPLHLRNLYLCLSYKAELLCLSPNNYPGQDLIKDSWEEVYCFTEQDLTTFNSLTKSPIFN